MDLDVKPSKGSRITEFDIASEAQGAMRNGLVWLSNYIPRTLTPVLLQSGEAMVSREAKHRRHVHRHRRLLRYRGSA